LPNLLILAYLENKEIEPVIHAIDSIAIFSLTRTVDKKHTIVNKEIAQLYLRESLIL